MDNNNQSLNVHFNYLFNGLLKPGKQRWRFIATFKTPFKMCDFSLFQLPGTLRALPTLVHLPNGQVHSIQWGLPESSVQKETLMVGYALRHYAAVDVSVVGVRVTEEHSYTGTLTSIFPGGARYSKIDKIKGPNIKFI